MMTNTLWRAAIVLALACVPLVPAPAAAPPTFIVTNPAASGSGTLRHAIEWANSDANHDIINFSIPSCGTVCTIELTGTLPALTNSNIVVNGYTQPLAKPASGTQPATLKVEIDGAGYDCFAINTANNVITGLAIHSCGTAIRITGSGATGNVITGTHIGTNAAGTVAHGNTHAGVWISGGAQNNSVGGETSHDRNVISGNDTYGVRIENAGTALNTVAGNYIGTDSGGLGDMGNGYSGVYISSANNNVVGGDTPGERNVISGNDRHGVYIRGTSAINNSVLGNYIGAARDALDGIYNGIDGVRIEDGASNNAVGGDQDGEQNLILGNAEDGVGIDGAGTSGNTVAGNIIGARFLGWVGSVNVNGIHVSGGAQDNTIGGDDSGERNVISGNSQCGVRIEGGGTQGNGISGNHIGTDAGGANELGNGQDGVLIFNGAESNIVGGSAASERNVISGNGWSGVSIYGSGTASNTVVGNYIGTDGDGDTDLGNALVGVFVGWGAQRNAVGGGAPGEGNVISGNDQDGVQIRGGGTSNNRVSGNTIGLDAGGMAALGNSLDGVRVYDGATLNVVGGDTSGERNTVSGNGLSGVSIYGSGTTSNTASGNYVGTSASGLVERGNVLYGIFIGYGAQNNIVGGDTAGERNLISGNNQDGVCIEGSGTDANTVSGNTIGTTPNGSASMANQWNGVRITGGAHGNTIGGDAGGSRNLISGNDRYGVRVEGSGTDGNTISGNTIGTMASGLSALGNGDGGVFIVDGAHHNRVGGNTPAERNVISGNFVGVQISGSGTDHNTVSGNYIGVSVGGGTILPNTWSGVYISSGAQRNTIGGGTTAERNVLSGNAYYGIFIQGSGTDENVISHNAIGTTPGGGEELGNGRSGVRFYNHPDDNTVGPGNAIAYNDWYGVAVDGSSADGNTITRNSIHDNGLAGIDLANGANGGIAAPAVVTTTRGSTVIAGTACAGCTVEVFGNEDDDGEGSHYLGEARADAGGAFTLTVGLLGKPYLTATATDAAQGTSEFSASFVSTALSVGLPLVVRGD